MERRRIALTLAALVAAAACRKDGAPPAEPAKPAPASTAASPVAADATTAATTGTSGDATGGASTTTAAGSGAAGGNLLNLERPAYDKSAPNWKLGVQMPKVANFDPKKDYFVTLHTTFGDITLRLFPDVAPQHVTSFINLVEIGFYDDVRFHRIIPGFMMQGGDPLGQGSGGPAYKMKAEFNPRKHLRGTLAAARTPDPNSAGSQFYICFKETPFLDNQYTVFGEVTQGLDIVDKFEKIGTPSGKPTADARIVRAEAFTTPKGRT